MFRPVLIAIVAAGALGACTVSSDRPYPSSANNPPGWVDANRDGIDDRTQTSRAPNPYNPPGWVDYNRDGVDDRTQSRRTSYSSGSYGYYDSYGNWRSN